MKQTKIIQKTCLLLKKRVKFENAKFSLQEGLPTDEDTTKIKKTTEVYVKTWVIPIIDAIEKGDTKFLKKICKNR